MVFNLAKVVGKMIQTIRNSIPASPKGRRPEFDYAEVISIALKSELGRDPNRVKIVAYWTGANERTVINWLEGTSGPNGKYLIRLLRKSNVVYEMTMGLAQRPEAIAALNEKLLVNGNPANKSAHTASAGKPTPSLPDVPDRVPDVPGDDPEIDYVSLRQQWFLQCLARKPNASCRDIKDFFGVSLKTAKRDIASLKARNKIVFRGSQRKGRYVLVEEH